MSEIKLLPCPFCGGDAAFGSILYGAQIVKEQNWGQDTFYTVSCVKCNAKTETIVGQITSADAAQLWNRRTSDAE